MLFTEKNKKREINEWDQKPVVKTCSQTTFTRGGGVGGREVTCFCQRLKGTKCQRRGVDGQKKAKTCQRSLWTTPKAIEQYAQVYFCKKPKIAQNPPANF